MRTGRIVITGGLLVIFASCTSAKIEAEPRTSAKIEAEPRTSAKNSGGHEAVEGAAGGEANESAEAAERKKDNRKIEFGQAVSEAERWKLTDAKAKEQLAGKEWGEREIRWFWQRKGWHMTKMEEQYASEVESLLKTGDIVEIAPWYVCPYAPVYQAVRPTTVMGKPVQRMQEFYFDGCENDDDLLLGNPRLSRGEYQADHDESFSDGKHQGGVPQGATGERRR
jgi:hypothetical protein